MTLPVAILAGGLATRLRPLTDTRPKSLVPVAGRPFADHQLQLLQRQGIREVVWLVGHLGDRLEAALGDGRQWGMRFRWVHDGAVARGTGGAVRRALPWLGTRFFVLYGDSYLPWDFAPIERAFTSSACLGLMTVYRNEGRFGASNVWYSDGHMHRYDKQTPSAEMRHIDWGLGAFVPGAFEPYARDAPLDLAQVYQDLLARNQLAAIEVPERFYEIGSPAGLADTEAFLLQQR